jgi:hypothetical protein
MSMQIENFSNLSDVYTDASLEIILQEDYTCIWHHPSIGHTNINL